MSLIGHHREGPTSRLAKHEPVVIPDFENASCEGSNYFLDWGSSGMKVYRVHAELGAAPVLEPSRVISGSLQALKLNTVTADISVASLTSALDTLSGRLGSAVKAGSGAMLATAGMRLDPSHAEELWAGVRQWATLNPGMFRRCGQTSDTTDCRTLPGSEEARYEMLAMLETDAGRELARSAAPFGFASSGGASIQVGLRGPEAELRHCLDDLGQLDSRFDALRSNVRNVSGAPALLVSFISIFHNDSQTCAEVGDVHACDYNAGGLDQMRAGFDKFLIAQGRTTNPCLPVNTELQPSPKCEGFFNTSACVIDGYGGKISMLPASPGPPGGRQRMEVCSEQVQQFLRHDLLLSRWAGSSSCVGLARGAERWAFLTSFARETQLGADVSHGWEAFSEVRAAAESMELSSVQAPHRGDEGIVLSSVLLVRFLEMLGIRPSAQVRGADAEWADAAMRERGLARGWAPAGACPGLPSAAHGAKPLLQVLLPAMLGLCLAAR